MTNWKIPGREETGVSSVSKSSPFGDSIQVVSEQTIAVDLARDSGETAEIADVADDDLIVLEYEDGFVQWIRADQFRQDFDPQLQQGRGKNGDLWIPPQLSPVGVGSSRGTRSWGLKLLRRLKVTIAEKLTQEADVPGVAASKLCNYLEKRAMPAPGFFRLGEGATLQPVRKGEVSAEKPILVFVHGTFSSTSGSFSDLAKSPANWAAIREQYGTDVYALDHHTLAASPIENAIALLTCLPANAQLDMVSHSRGGLVCELLCRAGRKGGQPFDDDDFRIILGDPDDSQLQYREVQQQSLRELNDLLIEKKPTINRFVRVACPAAGTSLAAGRLDRWLSILLNAVNLIPGLALSPTYDLITGFTQAVLKKRMDPSRFPGLEAMSPVSPLIRILNRRDVETASDLSVIAGDLKGNGFWGSLKTWATDLAFLSDHDLVVNTNSMYGGIQRSTAAAGGRYFMDQGPKVDHFHYFANPATVKILQAGLADEQIDDWSPLAEKRRSLEERRFQVREAVQRSQQTDTPTVFVLPGIMGSSLKQGDRRVWVNPLALATGGLSNLQIDQTGVAADGLLDGPYLDLLEHLSHSHRVRPFPYDWRRSVLDEADRLAEVVKQELKSNKPIRFVAHSMGGLVVRAMIARHPGLWKQIVKEDGARFIMLGTPNGGSFEILRVLLGRAKLIRLLGLVDVKNSRRELLEVVSRFPGILELLPGGSDDYFDSAIWNSYLEVQSGWAMPDPTRLAAARKARSIIQRSPLDRERMIYVAGTGSGTPVGVKIDDGWFGKRIRFLGTDQGDGTVAWSDGIPGDIPVWYMDAEHGKLADHKTSFLALEELLEKGDTERLSQNAPAGLRGTQELYELDDDEIASYPLQTDLEAAALGFTPDLSSPVREQPLRVSVLHDHLAFARYPVLVGHHQDDLIVGAEKALDSRLEGKLSRRRDLGLYPGPIGSGEVILPPEDSSSTVAHRGAIVVGLGRVGELLSNRLEETVTKGALLYALRRVERPVPDGASVDEPVETGISSLIVGSGFGGLGTHDSLCAILNGVLRANAELAASAAAESKLPRPVRITEVQFVELYRDRAIRALMTLQTLSREAILSDRLRVDHKVSDGSAGWSRIPPDEDRGWWHRLRIARRAEDDPTLTFTAMTGLARAEVHLLAFQQHDLNQFVCRAVGDTRWNESVANTLFHMLLPNELKRLALDSHNLVLLVDAQAAAFPWELLHDRTVGDAPPFVTRGGLIRQLATERFRVAPETVRPGHALVVGDPRSDFAELPGAQREAQQVEEELLAAGLKVEFLLRPAAAQVQTALFAQDYQVLHLAGHGVVDFPLPNGEQITGMVLGNGSFLTPGLVRQLPRVPELVFINCCHLGDQRAELPPRDDFNRLAANVATEFIEMGVRAVVAAGWAVDDRAALTFAQTFYDHMGRGDEFGPAVKAARAETYRQHPAVNTWGAYQCYGDPGYRLNLQRRWSSSEDSAPVSPDHAVMTFDNIKQQAAAGEAGDWLSQKLNASVAALERDPEGRIWLKNDARLNEAIADAYREVRQFEKAIAHYDQALAAPGGGASLDAVERRANLRAREAEASRHPAKEIHRSITELEDLVRIAETAERRSLLGFCYKRLEAVTKGKAKAEALASAIENYKRAWELMKESADPAFGYPLSNFLSLDLAANAIYKLKWDDYLEQLDLAGTPLLDGAGKREFWTFVVPVDCRTLRAMHDGVGLNARAKQLSTAYIEVFRQAGSRRELDSVVDQLKVLAGYLKRPRTSTARKKDQQSRIDFLETIIKTLEKELST